MLKYLSLKVSNDKIDYKQSYYTSHTNVVSKANKSTGDFQNQYQIISTYLKKNIKRILLTML